MSVGQRATAFPARGRDAYNMEIIIMDQLTAWLFAKAHRKWRPLLRLLMLAWTSTALPIMMLYGLLKTYNFPPYGTLRWTLFVGWLISTTIILKLLVHVTNLTDLLECLEVQIAEIRRHNDIE
jgi:hypothetical protein